MYYHGETKECHKQDQQIKTGYYRGERKECHKQDQQIKSRYYRGERTRMLSESMNPLETANKLNSNDI